jgi:glutamate racemase
MIGIFDSGVGGLTVVKEVFKHLSDYQIIYFGDTARLPYGTKGANFVKKYSDKITGWLLNKKAKIIIIACHTSSAWASDALRKKYKDVPIFDMINSAINDVIKKTKNKKIGIIGTPGTVESGSWSKKLLEKDKSLTVYSVSCPLFVPLVEMGFTKGKVTEEITKEYLKGLKSKKIDTLVLACTHYPLLKKTIEKVMGKNVVIVDPAESVVREIKLFLNNNIAIEKKIKKAKGHMFFFSDKPYNLEKISHLCFNQAIKNPKIKDPFNQ